MYRENANPTEEVRLYDGDGIGIATFVGSPLAGAIAWALNLRRLGEARRAWAVVALGVAVTVAWILVAQHLPNGAAIGGNVGLAMGARQAAARWFADASTAQRLPPVTWHSRWRAAAVGALGCVLVLAAIVGFAALAPDSLQDRIEFRPGVHVYYDGGATPEGARRVAEELDRMGFFAAGHAIDVRYEGTATGHAVSFVVPRDRVLNDAEVRDGFRDIGRALQPHTDPRGHLEVRLCSDDWTAHTSYSFPESGSTR